VGAVDNSLDAILAATRQVPRDQWAIAKYALECALADEVEAYCEAVLDDLAGVCVRARNALLFVRYDELGLAVTFLGSLRGGSLTETTRSRQQGMAELVGEFDLRLRYDRLPHHLSIQTTGDRLEQVAPIRDILRSWSADPS
jgi:hypothetical protein